MRVSIIIVTWNALPLIQKCLPSVVASTYSNLEIIIADNASTDETAEWIESRYPNIRIVRHPENWAFAKGNNEAVPHATGDIVLFLNNDVEVTPDWLEPIVRVFEENPDVAVVQPKLLQYTDRGRFEYAGASGGFLDRYGYPFTRGRIFFELEADNGQYDDSRDIFWASGAAMAVRKSALDEVGMFDEHFVMHMEEIDLCWRMQANRYRIRVEPASHVYHIGGASLPTGDSRKTYYNFRNSLLMLYKNLTPGNWIRVFPQRALLDGLAMLRALVTGRFSELRAIIRALYDAHRMRELYDEVRPVHQTVLPTYKGSIVLDYFLRRRKTFASLPAHKFEDTDPALVR